jgi:hypothetical protein
MFTGFPEDCTQHGEKQKYVDSVNEGMRWSKPDELLKAEDVEENVALRNFYKLLMVSR